MALNTIQPNTSGPFAGLGTAVCNIVTAGQYVASFISTLPANSGLQVQIKKNSSVIITVGGATTNPTPSQISMGSSAKIQVAAGDVISFVFSSSAAADNQALNGPTSIINVFQGF